jgi:hypothetical protein
MVARWFIFKSKIQIWVYFGGPCNVKCCYFYDRLVYFTAICYNLCPFGIVCGHLVYFPILVCLNQEKSGNPGDNNIDQLHPKTGNLKRKYFFRLQGPKSCPRGAFQRRRAGPFSSLLA